MKCVHKNLLWEYDGWNKCKDCLTLFKERNKVSRIQTFTNKLFDIYELNNINIEDIAHSLSMLCRYNGHCSKFYSVAQHSVLMSNLVSKQNSLSALLHDAAEAYIGDIPKPFKEYYEISVYGEINTTISITKLENFILYKVMNMHDLLMPLPKEVEVADKKMLATEYRQLFSKVLLEIEETPYSDLKIESWNPDKAEYEFLKKYRELV